MIKVSVIVPIYNVANYLTACIESLVHQTMNDVEYILVDDGSIDESSKIADWYSERYNHITVIHKENEGVTLTRKRGLARAQGDYILFLDADDFLEPDALERMYARAKETKADWVVGDYYICFPNGIRTERRFTDFGVVDYIGFLNYCYSESDFYYMGRLIRRDFLLTAQANIPPEITYGEDNLAVTQYASQVQKAAKVNAFVLNYVQRSSSVTNKMNAHDFQMRAKALCLCYDFLKSLPCYPALKQSSDNYFIKELCSFIARGYYDDNLSFSLKDCHLTGQQTIKTRTLFALAKMNMDVALRFYKVVKVVSTVLKTRFRG